MEHMKYITAMLAVPGLSYLSHGAFKEGQLGVGTIMALLAIVIFVMAVNDLNRGPE